MIAMKQLVAVATLVTSVACGPVPALPKELVSQIGVAMEENRGTARSRSSERPTGNSTSHEL